MVAGFNLTVSNEFAQPLRIGNQHDIISGKKGNKAISGLQPDPRKVIPLDETDHNILTTF
jgi:hypothetical protein